MYLDGHGEKNLIGLKNNDLGEFGKQLENKGFKFSNPDLTVIDKVPSEGAMLVIASPKVDVTEVEANKILTYLNEGGNLFWLLEDDNLRGLDKVAEYLGLSVSDNKGIDPSSVQFGVSENVAFALAYGEHPITNNFMLRTQYLDAYEIKAKGTFENGWDVSNLIEVAPNGWISSKKDKNKQLNFDKVKIKKGQLILE